MTQTPLANVTVEEARAKQRRVLDRLAQLYLDYFPEFAPIDSPPGEVDAEWRFANEWLEVTGGKKAASRC